jgi:hypothetical protein
MRRLLTPLKHIGCGTSYQHNYSVFQNTRTYYTDVNAIPEAIQVGEHRFFQREVLNMFIGLMLISWYACFLHPAAMKPYQAVQDVGHKRCKNVQLVSQ